MCFLRALSHRLKESSPPLLSHCAVRTPSSTVRAKAIQLGVHQVRFRQSLAQSLIRLFRGVSFHFLSFTSMPPLRLGKAATTDRVRPSQSVGHLGFKRSNSTAPAVINNRKVPLPSCLPSLPPSLPFPTLPPSTLPYSLTSYPIPPSLPRSINDIATAAKTVARSAAIGNRTGKGFATLSMTESMPVPTVWKALTPRRGSSTGQDTKCLLESRSQQSSKTLLQQTTAAAAPCSLAFARAKQRAKSSDFAVKFRLTLFALSHLTGHLKLLRPELRDCIKFANPLSE